MVVCDTTHSIFALFELKTSVQFFFSQRVRESSTSSGADHVLKQFRISNLLPYLLLISFLSNHCYNFRNSASGDRKVRYRRQRALEARINVFFRLCCVLAYNIRASLCAIDGKRCCCNSVDWSQLSGVRERVLQILRTNSIKFYTIWRKAFIENKAIFLVN